MAAPDYARYPDLAGRTDLCGAFKVPTLRNVATRQAFFHNGLFKNLRDAIRFYVRRETNPEEFYPRDAQGIVHKFDDLPPEMHRNVNTVKSWLARGRAGLAASLEGATPPADATTGERHAG